MGRTEGEPLIATSFLDALQLVEDRRVAHEHAGHSLIGPHRDELEILSDGRDVARYGSAGQQRSALILLDLAQISIYNSTYEESPVLLIDDIDAELDRGRIEALLSELEGRTQTFVSTSRRGSCFPDFCGWLWVLRCTGCACFCPSLELTEFPFVPLIHFRQFAARHWHLKGSISSFKK